MFDEQYIPFSARDTLPSTGGGSEGSESYGTEESSESSDDSEYSGGGSYYGEGSHPSAEGEAATATADQDAGGDPTTGWQLTYLWGNGHGWSS